MKLTLVDSNLPELLDAHPFDSKRIEDFSSAVSDSTATVTVDDIDWDGPLDAAVARLESVMLLRALAACAGNRSQAARRLGLSRQQLYRKLAQYGME